MTIQPTDLVNRSVQSGFDHVILSMPSAKPFFARAYGGDLDAAGRSWQGPRRLTAYEAAADYCNYANGAGVGVVLPLRKAGHTVRRVKKNVPQEVNEARATIRKYKESVETPGGFVYLVTEKGSGTFVKIGESRDDPSARLPELQTGNPRLLVLLGSIKTDDRKALESKLHQRFIKHNVLQEWFINRPEIRKAFSL